MVRRTDILWSVLIGCGATLLALAITDTAALFQARGFLHQFRGPTELSEWMPTVPFILAGVRIVLFHVLFGCAVGAALYAIVCVLGSQKNAGGRWEIARASYYPAFLSALALVLLYLHGRAMLIYPGLFDSSWRWAALAASPTVVTLYGVAGKAALAIVLVAAVNRRRAEIAGWLQRRKRPLAGAVLLLATVLAGRAWLNRTPNENRGPNVIILGMDSLRPDHVSGLGYGRKTTPNLDRFLAEATVFTHTFAPLARTGPAWISILTGCYPTRHGHRDDLPPKEERIPPVANLAQHLKGLGYETAFFLDNTNFMWMEPEMGFDHIGQPRPNVVWFGMSFLPFHFPLYYYCLNNPAGFLYEPMLRANQAFYPVYDWRYFARDIVRRLKRMKGSEKFFLAAHTCIGHAPFAVRYPYSTYFSPPPPTPSNRFVFRWPFERVLSEKEILRRSRGRERALLFSQEINLYDALMRQSDDWLGAVLDALRRLDLYDNSLIVVLGDHGEDLYRPDHVYQYITSSHGFHAWGDDSFRVLMAVKLPRPARRVGRVDHLVRLIDVAPTILDILHLPPLPDAEGLSLRPQIEEPARDPGLTAYQEAGLTLPSWFIPGHRLYPFEHWVLFQYVDPESLRIYRKKEYMPGFVMAKDRALRESRWKIVAYPMRGEGPLPFRTTLHEAASDPTSRLDVASSHPAVLADMRDRLAPYIEEDARRYGFEWRWMSTTETMKLLQEELERHRKQGKDLSD